MLPRLQLLYSKLFWAIIIFGILNRVFVTAYRLVYEHGCPDRSLRTGVTGIQCREVFFILFVKIKINLSWHKKWVPKKLSKFLLGGDFSFLNPCTILDWLYLVCKAGNHCILRLNIINIRIVLKLQGRPVWSSSLPALTVDSTVYGIGYTDTGNIGIFCKREKAFFDTDAIWF